MIDPLILAVFAASLIVVGAGGFSLATIRERRRVVIVPPTVDLFAEQHIKEYAELADLRHIKEQLNQLPPQREHIWPREPDVRKMGWLRFRCAVGDCQVIQWKRIKR